MVAGMQCEHACNGGSHAFECVRVCDTRRGVGGSDGDRMIKRSIECHHHCWKTVVAAAEATVATGSDAVCARYSLDGADCTHSTTGFPNRSLFCAKSLTQISGCRAFQDGSFRVSTFA